MPRPTSVGMPIPETLLIALLSDVRRLISLVADVQARTTPQNVGLKVMAMELSTPLRSYLNQARTRAILGCFLALSLLFIVFPSLDIRISALFYDDGFYMASQRWTNVLHASVPWFVGTSVALLLSAYVFNRLLKRNLLGVDGRKVAYLLLVLTLGGGLIVNGILKDGFGRERPRNIEEFGGAGQFTPAYVIGSDCDRNCSFSSGDAAGAFFSLAFILAFKHKRAITTAAVGYGVLVSAARIASGAHFLSDTIVSFFVMLMIADALHYRMFVFNPAPVVLAPSMEPAPVPTQTVLISAPEKP